MRGIARLAKELGISTGTVSRALNGRPDVNAETRRLVLEAARRRNYAPNHAARALAQGSTRSVGFMMDLDRETAASSEYFFMGVFDGVQSVLARQGLDLLVLPRPTGQEPTSFLERYVARGAFDGLILSSVQRVDPRIDLLESAGVPFVTLGRSSSGTNYPWIDMDFEGVADIAIDRLVSRGHRRIAVTLPFGGINFGFVFADAYAQALTRHGLPFDPQLTFVTKRNEEAGAELVDRMRAVADPPTAVLLIYETTAIGLYRRLAELGGVPGRDLAVIGFRDEPTIRFLNPSLTCFSVSLPDLGEQLAMALLGAMSGHETGSSESTYRRLVSLMLRPGDSG
jgi:DNA-binding LacI/PurR family transcriptional regulator